MRRIRHQQGLSIPDVRDRTGIAQGELSMFERGHSIPRGDQVPRLVPVYGDPAGWWPKGVRRALTHDLTDCPGCGDELEPDAAANRRIHDDPACRARARQGGPNYAVLPAGVMVAAMNVEPAAGEPTPGGRPPVVGAVPQESYPPAFRQGAGEEDEAPMPVSLARHDPAG